MNHESKMAWNGHKWSPLEYYVTILLYYKYREINEDEFDTLWERQKAQQKKKPLTGTCRKLELDSQGRCVKGQYEYKRKFWK